jgi:hypothetical protein
MTNGPHDEPLWDEEALSAEIDRLLATGKYSSPVDAELLGLVRALTFEDVFPSRVAAPADERPAAPRKRRRVRT